MRWQGYVTVDIYINQIKFCRVHVIKQITFFKKESKLFVDFRIKTLKYTIHFQYFTPYQLNRRNINSCGR